MAFLLPISEAQVWKAVQGLRVNALLEGWRGKPRGDTKALVENVLKLAEFVEKHGDRLAELELNPLIVRPQGKGVVAADALIRFK